MKTCVLVAISELVSLCIVHRLQARKPSRYVTSHESPHINSAWSSLRE